MGHGGGVLVYNRRRGVRAVLLHDARLTPEKHHDTNVTLNKTLQHAQNVLLYELILHKIVQVSDNLM
jgi:hypothetical protein